MSELTKKVNRASRAEKILNDKMITEAFDTIRDNLHSKWENTKAEDKEAREIFYMQIKCLESVREYFKTVIIHGKHALHKLEELNK